MIGYLESTPKFNTLTATPLGKDQDSNLELLKKDSNLLLLHFAEGGLVDFTGPAWVDGTPTRPEAFLDATDTAMLQKLTNALNYVNLSPGIWPDADAFSGGNTTYGNLSIVINQAELKTDADFEDVAHRIGKAFTKEMSKKGYNLTGYNL